MKTITVRSIPADDPPNPTGALYLDCSECGPLGLAQHQDDARDMAANHLDGHGIDTSKIR